MAKPCRYVTNSTHCVLRTCARSSPTAGNKKTDTPALGVTLLRRISGREVKRREASPRCFARRNRAAMLRTPRTACFALVHEVLQPQGTKKRIHPILGVTLLRRISGREVKRHELSPRCFARRNRAAMLRTPRTACFALVHEVLQPQSAKRAIHHFGCMALFGAPAENRTPDTLIKSQVLYQLSYRGVWIYRMDTLIKSQVLYCTESTGKNIFEHYAIT